MAASRRRACTCPTKRCRASRTWTSWRGGASPSRKPRSDGDHPAPGPQTLAPLFVLAIVVQTFIAAPAEEVWAQLHASADIVLDALPVTAWPSEGREEQAPLHFAVPFPVGQVQVTLHDVGGGVRLDLRHHRSPETPPAETMVQGHFAGWLQGLAALGHFIQTGQDAPPLAPPPPYFIS